MLCSACRISPEHWRNGSRPRWATPPQSSMSATASPSSSFPARLPAECWRSSAASTCTSTPATLWLEPDGASFGLAVPLTFAQSFVHHLLAASAETGFEVLRAAED
jgi:hypothetical protein